MENIIQRLQLQSGTFQESFSRLKTAKSAEQLGERFFEVLNRNLGVNEAVILLKKHDRENWQLLFAKKKSYSDYHSVLTDGSDFTIMETDHPDFQLSVINPVTDSVIFGILLGRKKAGSGFTDSDKILLYFLLQQLDSAYQFYMANAKEKQLVFSLNHRVLQLNSLIDTSIEISRLQEGSQLLRLALERVLALTNASKGMLRVNEGRRVVEKFFFPFQFKSRQQERGKHKISASFRFLNHTYRFYLFEKESREGLVSFDATDQLLLDAFTRQVHVSLENNYLYQQSLEKERTDHEIAIAGSIQKNIIPNKLPEIEGYDLHGINIPTKYIGGDYYDCIPLKNGRFMFIMADVSGKGVSAGLLVSTLHAAAHAYLDGAFELVSLIQKLNQVIVAATTDDKYITAVFAILNPVENELDVVNAGHNPTYILRKNRSIEEVKTGGIPLGFMSMPFPYESSKLTLNQGDSVFFYTDGVTEAMNEKNEEYDIKRPVREFLVSHQCPTAEDFIGELMADIRDFTGDTPQSDDITSLFLMRKE